MRLVSKIFNMPTVMISLVDADRTWFKSCVGCELRQINREDARTVVVQALADRLTSPNERILAAARVSEERFVVIMPIESDEGNSPLRHDRHRCVFPQLMDKTASHF